MSILVVGEALVDVVTSANGETVERPGGSPANVAVGLGRLGCEVKLLTALGEDVHGARVRAHLESSTVEVMSSRLLATSVAKAQLDADGRATYVFEFVWDLADLPSAAPAAWLHVGSLGVTQLPGSEQVASLVAQHSEAVISYDPNCRPLLMNNPAAVVDRIENQVARSALVKLSEEDADWLCPGEPLEQFARRWLALGPTLVVVTCGERGAQAWTADHHLCLDAAVGGPIVDTVGAGDAFMAGLIWSLANTDLHALSTSTLRTVLTTAQEVARRTCERAGADPPWRAELGVTIPRTSA